MGPGADARGRAVWWGGGVRSEIRSGDPGRGGIECAGADPWPAAIGGELRAVLASARRRAVRDGDRLVDTAHLLHSLLESGPRVHDVLAAAGGRPVRVLGYLAQRSIGYGLRWHGAVEDTAAGPGTPQRPAAGVSPSVADALWQAARYAAARGSRTADGADLLRALAADTRCRAAQVLTATGVDPARLVL